MHTLTLRPVFVTNQWSLQRIREQHTALQPHLKSQSECLCHTGKVASNAANLLGRVVGLTAAPVCLPKSHFCSRPCHQPPCEPHVCSSGNTNPAQVDQLLTTPGGLMLHMTYSRIEPLRP